MTVKSRRDNKKLIKKVQNLCAQNLVKTPQNNKAQKTRAKYECPKELAELIYVANFLPKEFHFDLIEAMHIKLKSFERFKPEIDFDNRTNTDDLLKRSRVYIERMEHWNNLQEFAFDHRATWLEFYLSLPEEVVLYLNRSKEIKDFRKSDSYEYWLNNDAEAWDKLSDLHNGDEITDKEFEHIKKTGDVADFLIEKGYYGERWSYLNQRNDDDDHKSKKRDGFYDSKYFALYRAYIRVEESRDFINGLADLAEQLRDSKNSFRVDLLDHLPKKLVEEIRATDIKINDKGEIRFSISKWAEAIQGVDISRIRRCEVCQKIFWANRKDAFACSIKHAKTRQMRLLRTNWKEKGTIYLQARKKKQTKKGE